MSTTRSSTPDPSEPRPIVLVDARNVVRSRWPNMLEERFVELARIWAEREGVESLLVFDGPALGGVGTRVLDERTTLVGTGAGSADDWIGEEARLFAGDARTVWAVTSDRELRERLAPYVARVIGGGAFVRVLEELERDAT